MLRRHLSLQHRSGGRDRRRRGQDDEPERYSSSSPAPADDDSSSSFHPRKPGLLRGQVEAWTNLVARYRRDHLHTLRNPQHGIYHPLDPTKSQIRILTILPSGSHSDSTICCTISTLSLDLAAKVGYDALSYCWGSKPGDTLTVLVNDVLREVTPNLESALRCLRDSHEPVRLWADALCINQEDVRERNHQVGMMQKIYRNAKVVRVSLNSVDGEDRATLEESLGAVKGIMERRARWARKNAYTPAYDYGGYGGEERGGGGNVRFRSPWEGSMTEGFSVLAGPTAATKTTTTTMIHDEHSEVSLKTFPEAETTPPPDPSTAVDQQHNMLGLSEKNVRDLANFFAHPWWSRIWVVQEVHLAANCEVHIGDSSVGFPDVVRAAERLWNVLESLQSTGQATGLDLPRLVEMTASAKAFLRILAVCRMESDDRGSLVQVLSEARALLATDPRDQVLGLIGLSSYLDKIEPDYSLSPERTFINASSTIMQTVNSLDILYLAGLQFNRLSTVPSWVPDWTTHSSGQSSRHISIRNLYLAAGKSEPSMNVRRGDELVVKSVSIDVISKTTAWCASENDPCYLQNLLNSICENSLALREHLGNQSQMDESVLEEVILAGMRTVAMDIVKSGGPLQRGFDSAIRHYFLTSRIKSFLSADLDITVQPAACDEPRSMRRFLKDEMISNVRGQRLGSTKTGRLCLLPELSQPGDTIQIIAGLSMPVVMRPCGRSRFQLVGVCYLDQLMDNTCIASCLQLRGSPKLYPFKTAVLV